MQRNRVKRLLREAFAALAEWSAPATTWSWWPGPAPRELAEREGLAGVQEALAELIGKAGLTAAADGGTVSSAAAASARSPRRRCACARTLVSAPIVVYQRLISPAIPRRCKYEPSCSRYAVRRSAVRHGPRAWCSPAGAC